jgi:hypothetical protein
VSDSASILRLDITLRADPALLDLVRALVERAGGATLQPPATPMPAHEPLTYVWTADRDAVLREGWPRGDSAGALWAQVNGLPGPPISSMAAVTKRAGRLGLVRDSGVAKAQPRTHWSGARDAVLQECYPRGDALQTVLLRVNALPGPPIASLDALAGHAKGMGLHRNQEALYAHRVATAARMREIKARKASAAHVRPAEPGPEPPAPPPVAIVAPPAPAAIAPPPPPKPLADIPAPSRIKYDWLSEYVRDGRVLCDAARIAAYAARYDLRWDGDMLPINQHRLANGRLRMSLCEPALLPAEAAYPVAA